MRIQFRAAYRIGFFLVVLFWAQPSKSSSQLSAPAASAASQNPLLGTWNLNPLKSKFLPGPAPRSERRTYELKPNGIKVTIRTIYSDGRSMNSETIADYDGSQHIVVGNPDADAIRLKKIDDYTAETTVEHAGAIVARARRVISEDGKTMTITFKGTRNGQEVNDVAVFDKET